MATRMCLFPPLGERAYARLVELAVGYYALPSQGSVEPWDAAWAVRRWNPQDQGSFALALIHLELRHPPNDTNCLWEMMATILSVVEGM